MGEVKEWEGSVHVFTMQPLKTHLFILFFNRSGQRPLWRRPFLRRRMQGAEPTRHSGASNVEGVLMCDTSHTVVRSEVSVAASEAFRQTNKNREHNLFCFLRSLFILCVFF